MTDLLNVSALPAVDRAALRIMEAEAALKSPDLYTREAGAQSLAGLVLPDALRLLEKACGDRENRVAEGGARALLASAAAGNTEAEAALLRVITRGRNSRLLAEMLAEGKPDCLGALAKAGQEARRFQFLVANPDLARCRLSSLESGMFRQVQALRSARLRSIPSFAALFDVIRNDPDLPRTLKTMLSRRSEFVKQGGQPRSLEPFWGDIRRMTGVLAGFAADPALTALCELVIDRTVKRESAAVWDRLKTEVLYVPELVIGAGPHSANFCATLAILRPDRLPLVIERRGRIGGQFAAPGGAAWFLNSRSRPASADRQFLPGSGQGLNAIGAYAPVQEADLTGQSYAAQDRIALATRLSLFLSCQALVGASFVQRFPNNAATRQRLDLPADNQTQGRYLAQLQNVATGELRYLATDSLIFAGGVGEPKAAFRDPQSRKAIAIERSRPRREGTPRYQTFDDFMARLNDPANPFPLRGVKTAIVVGDGDSAKVAIEALLGYGPSAAWSVHSLDRVQKVLWIGQKTATRERFLDCERPRYHLLALELPREVSPSLARIQAVPERATSFSVEGEQAVVTTGPFSRYSGDLVIDCGGFESAAGRTPKPLSEFAGKLKDGSKLRVCDALGTEAEILITCQSVTLLPTQGRKYRIIGAMQSIFGRPPLYSSVPFTIEECAAGEVGNALERCLRQSLNEEGNSRYYLKNTTLPAVFATINGERRPIARQEGGESVYYLGPQAGLPFPKEVAEQLGVGEENAVVLWRYTGEVTAFAEQYFANIYRRVNAANSLQPVFAIRELRPSRSKKDVGDVALGPLRFEEAPAWPASLDTRRLLHYLLCEHLRSFRLPAERLDRTLVLQLTPIPKAEGQIAGLEARADMPSIDGVGLLPLLEALATDPLLQQAVFRIGLPGPSAISSGRGQPQIARVAVRSGRLRLLSIREI